MPFLSRAKSWCGRLSSGLLSAALGGAIALGGAGAAQAQQVIWEDEFPGVGARVDASKWQMGDNSNFIHRTRFGHTPQVLAEGDTTFARIRMDSYNPSDSESFLGTEITSRPKWSVGTGLEWTARLRGTDVPKGIVYSFYTYRLRDYALDGDQEELDFEFLSNWVHSSSGHARTLVWTNVWNYSSENGSNRGAACSVPGLDQTQWHTYTIRWRPNSVEWLVDGVLTRTETALVPDDELAVRFNIWAPGPGNDGKPGWDTAYDPSMTLTRPPEATRTDYFDVDYIRVTRLPAPSGQGAIGSGEGLTSVYYNAPFSNGADEPQYREEKLSRFARNINFEAWGTAPPDQRLGRDNWGATFKGELQAQFSEPTTLSLKTQSSDGVRLWLGNQLVINKLPISGPDSQVESTYTAALQAGTRYPIRIEFWDGTGAAAIRFAWSSASLPRQFVSTAQLYPTVLPTPLLSPPPGSYSSAQNVAVTSVEAGADLHYTLDGSEPQRSGPSPTDGAIALSTSATLRVKAWKDGFWSSATAGGPYAIDGVAPTLALATPREGISYTSLPIASGTASDSGSSGLDRVSARLSRSSDGLFLSAASTWGPQTDLLATLSGATWSLPLPTLADGSYTLRVQAVDRAGNASAPITASFSIDNSSPALTADAPIEGGAYALLPAASGIARDGGQGISEVRASLKRADGAFWNGSDWGAAAVNFATDFSAPPAWKLALPALDDGAYTLSVSSYDQARNATTIARSFIIDGTSPTVAIGGPSPDSILRSAFVLNGSARDAASGIAGVGVHIQRAEDGAFWNGSVWGPDAEVPARVASDFAGGANWTLSLPLFADGTYSALIVTRDRAGNAAQSRVRWRLDANAPLLKVEAPVTNPTLSAWSAPRGTAWDGEGGSGVVGVTLLLRSGGTFWNGAAWVASEAPIAATLSGTSWSWPASIALPPAVDGAYDVIAIAVDGAGWSTSVQASFTIAVPAPAPTATPVAPPVPTATPAPTMPPTPPAPVDRVAPRASVASPPNGSMWRVLPVVRGLASDNVGIARAQASLFRYADRRYWNGSAWVATPATLQLALSGSAQSSVWSLARLPQGANAPAGLYALTVTVADSVGLRASATSIFRIDLRAPAITWAQPSTSPLARVLLAPPARLVLRAADDASGTRSAQVMLWRRADGRYWNGRAWSTSAVRLPLSAVNPTLGARPTAVLWQSTFALPAASQWLPGSYALVAIASDWVGNASNSRLEFTLAPPSPFVLSTARAQVGASTITLAFSGPLDAVTAQSLARFRVSVNGVGSQILSARYSTATRNITLLVGGEVAIGAPVQVAWSGLRDSSQRSLRDGAIALTAR